MLQCYENYRPWYVLNVLLCDQIYIGLSDLQSWQPQPSHDLVPKKLDFRTSDEMYLLFISFIINKQTSTYRFLFRL